VSRTSSRGSSSSWRPRRPALTRIVSCASAASSTVVGRRTLADCAQVEPAVGRDHEDLELAVDRGQQRLEEQARLDPERAGDGDRVVARADLDAFVLVEPVLDPCAEKGLDRRSDGRVVNLFGRCDGGRPGDV
jgi:hypothetical protein